MSHINYLGGLKRELHHIRTAKDDDHTYEPAIVIMDHNHPGKSFIIPLDAFWKYVDPSTYGRDERTLVADQDEYRKRVASVIFQVQVAVAKTDKQRAAGELACLGLADAFARGTGVMLCTSFNLFKCLQMFDITPCAQSAAQLLLWIQDGLNDLKDMPEVERDEIVGNAGEVEFTIGGQKFTKPIEVTETEAIEGVE